MEKPLSPKKKKKKKNLRGADLKTKLKLEEKFISAYAASTSKSSQGDGRSNVLAAIQAGYSPATAKSEAYLQLKKEGLRERVKREIEDFRAECRATFMWNANKLIEVVEYMLPENQIPNPKCASVAVKAISELNKMCGYYAPIQTENKNENTETKRFSVEIKELMVIYDKQY